MMERTIDAILKMMPVQRASVFLVDRSSGVLRSFNTMPVAGDMRGTLRGGMRMEQLTIPMNTGIAGAVVNSARSEIVPEAHKDSRYNRSIESQTGFQTNNIITVPVLLKQSMMEERSISPGNPRIRSLTGALSAHARQSQQVVAVLQALNHDTSFTASDTSLLEALASLLSGVLARSALVDAAVREKNRASALLKCATHAVAMPPCRHATTPPPPERERCPCCPAWLSLPPRAPELSTVQPPCRRRHPSASCSLQAGARDRMLAPLCRAPHSRTQARTHARTRRHADTRTHARTHAHTHTHTHMDMRSHICALSWACVCSQVCGGHLWFRSQPLQGDACDAGCQHGVEMRALIDDPRG